MQRHFKRSFDSLDEIFGFIEDFFGRASIDESLSYAVSFAVEELFTNMVKYNPTGPDEILIGLEAVDGGIRVELVDYDSEPFDVSRAPRPRTDAPLKERTPGGLGLHLVKHMVDSLRYEYQDRRSTITFTRKTGSGDVRDQA
jgi:anti-sigma regulatory factor (Ser/Thr protein kinase)